MIIQRGQMRSPSVNGYMFMAEHTPLYIPVGKGWPTTVLGFKGSRGFVSPSFHLPETWIKDQESRVRLVTRGLC